MIAKYIEAAMRHAEYERLPGHEAWSASIPSLPGVRATGPDREALTTELRSSLERWMLTTLKAGELLPPIDGIAVPFRLVDRPPTEEDVRIAEETAIKLGRR